MKYEIRKGTLGREYVIQITIDDKSLVDPTIKVLNRAFQHFAEVRSRLKRIEELEEKEKSGGDHPDG